MKKLFKKICSWFSKKQKTSANTSDKPVFSSCLGYDASNSSLACQDFVNK